MPKMLLNVLCLQISVVGEQHGPISSSDSQSLARAASAPPSSSIIQQAFDASVIPGAPPGTVSSIVQLPPRQPQESTPVSQVTVHTSGSNESATPTSVVSQDLSFNVSGFSRLVGSGLFPDVYSGANTPNPDMETPAENSIKD